VSQQALKEEGGKFGIWGIVFLIPTVILFITAFVLSFGNNPGYDAMAYHLPLAAGYGVSNSIMVHTTVPLNYPSNAELQLRWFIFPRNDCLANLPCFFAAVLILALLYKLFRDLGIERQPALIAACTAATFPLLPYLSVDPNVDLLAVVPLLCALFLLISLHRTGCTDTASVCFFGLAIGLAAGSRFYLLPACAFLLLVLAFILLRSERSRFLSSDLRFNWPWFGRILLMVACCALIGGGFWYFRSAVLFGNPFYPIRMFGLPGLPLDYINTVVGIIHDKPWLIAIYPWREFDYSVFDNGVGGVFAAIVLPGMFWYPISMIRNWKGEKGQFRFERIFVYLCALFCLAFFVSRPSHYTRQVTFGILLSFFLVAEMWKRLRGLFFRVVLFLSFLLMCFSLEKAFINTILYRLAVPAREGAQRFGLPKVIDTLPQSRIFNAAAAYLTYGCMGRDYRHEVLTVNGEAKAQDVLDSRAELLLIYEKQRPAFQSSLHLEIVATESGPTPGESLLLYRVLPP
jgi:hypothetical protein